MSFDLTLTFDNGPDPSTTPLVLDILAARGLRTTFFVLGEKLDRHRPLAERAHAEGHWIGNHTWSHSTPLGNHITPDAAEREIAQTQRLLGKLAHPDRLFRPMGGGGVLGRHLLSPAAATLLQDGGYTCFLWDSVPRDWAEPDSWVETALDHCSQRPWTLTVLHDLPTGAIRHLPRFLDAVAARGGRIRQEIPPHCLPILRGQARAALTRYISIPMTTGEVSA